MPDIIRKLSIAGTPNDTRDIGAEAQNIRVSYDSSGSIISDIDAPGAIIDHTENLPDVLKDISLEAGDGISIRNGEISVKYGSAAGTAAQGNDARLSNARKNPNPVTFSDGKSPETKVSYDGSNALTVSYGDVGAAPAMHADSTAKYGPASKQNFGHVKIGDNIDVNAGVVSVPKATSSSLGVVKVDNDTITVDNNGTIKGKAAGGSNISIFTTDSSLYNKTVKLSAETGSSDVTVTLDGSGYGVIKGFMGTGLITVTTTTQIRTHPADTQVGALTITYFGNYTVQLAFWAATIVVSTTTNNFNGLTVYAKKDDRTVASGTFSNGSATLVVPEPGNYIFETTYSWATYQSISYSITAEITYNAVLNGFEGTINITTPNTEFYGSLISVTMDGDPIPSTAFDMSGQATYTALKPGTYVFTVTYQGEPYTGTKEVTSQGTYSLEIKMWTATIELNTRAGSELIGDTIVVTNSSGTTIGSTVFDENGEASFDVHEAGTYTFTVEHIY